jgi:plastocyanin
MLKQIAMALAFSLFSAPVAFAGSYTEITVSDGGTIKGSVLFDGKAPAAKTIKVDKDEATCGATVNDESLIVSKSGGIANAVVFISDISKGAKVEKKNIVLDQKTCTYAPHVQATTLGSSMQVLNSDDVLHNVHAYADAGKGSSVFNLALPLKGQKKDQALRKAGVMSFKCDAGHTWMSAFVHVFENPYFAVTAADGSFSIGNIPPGTYTLTVWHEKLGTTTQKIEVTASGISSAKFQLK